MSAVDFAAAPAHRNSMADWKNHNHPPQTTAYPRAPNGSPYPTYAQRRRSSAAHVRPPAMPPPNQPIPSLPSLPPSFEDPFSHKQGIDDQGRDVVNGDQAYYHPHHEPNPIPFTAASANAAGSSSVISAFEPLDDAFLSRSLSSTAGGYHPDSTATTNSQTALVASDEYLSDPPPRSILQLSAQYQHQQLRAPDEQHRLHQELTPDRLPLSPNQPSYSSTPSTSGSSSSLRPAESRPSSRKALTKALELAREAVKLDSTNDDPLGAVMAYGRSVALLSEVMERVRRGEDSTENHRRRNGRRRSVVAQEEEVKRLKSIHDTYADRMNILSLIYSIPPIPHSPTAVYASTLTVSTESAQLPSPTTSGSPGSDFSDPPPSMYTDQANLNGARGHGGDAYLDYSDQGSESGHVSLSMFGGDDAGYSSASSSQSHPYAAPSQEEPPRQPIRSGQPSTTQTGSWAPSSSPNRFRRPRASSALPPPPPPPLNSPPPAPHPPPPLPTHDPQHVFIVPPTAGLRPEPVILGHKRASSGSRLAALAEEEIDRNGRVSLARSQSQSASVDTPRHFGVERENYPLPPLPSPLSGQMSPGTPRTAVAGRLLPSPRLPNSDGMGQVVQHNQSVSSSRLGLPTPPLINQSTVMGTISQRRSKMSAPPEMVTHAQPPLPQQIQPQAPPQSITESVPPAANKSRLTASSLPASTASSLGIGRSRSSSQPGRRPSVTAGGQTSPLDLRPPVPHTASFNAAASTIPRKPSNPSKLGPGSVPMLNVQIENSVSPPSFVFSSSLVPPPPSFLNNLPTTPTSPLPPAPPNDTLRKPYHLMSLLRTTMTSKSGGYVTRRLHVPQEVWGQGGAKLNNLVEKVRVVEILCTALEDLEHNSVECFGAGNVSSGMALGIGSIGKKEGQAWTSKLEEFSGVCDGVVASFGKKLGVGEGFVTKKTSGVTSWGGKLTRQIDKFTNGKNLDSPAAYVQGLIRLFLHAQLLDEHTRALMAHPIAPAYATFTADVRMSVEYKLKRASDFFATVVLTFVIRDLSMLLDKYAKKCEKWLEE